MRCRDGRGCCGRSWKKEFLREQFAADVDVEKVSRLIISGLEGGMLVSRIEKNDQALQDAMEHLDSYLEDFVRASGPKRK